MLSLALAIFLCDQMTKIWVLKSIKFGHSIYVTSFFNLTHVYNEGAAFGLFADMGGVQQYFFMGIAITFIGAVSYMLLAKNLSKCDALGLSLLLGGAAGNLWDRVNYGHVVDFLHFHIYGYHFPSFNVADISICLGAGIIIAFSFWQQFCLKK